MVAEVTELLGGELAKPLHQPLEDVGRRLDKGAAATTPPGGDQALLPQDGQCLAQGDRRDTQLLRELCLGRELLAVEDEAETDGLA